MSAFIELGEVWRSYRDGAAERHALRGVSLAIERNSWVAVQGPSGSGKSTLLNVIGGLDGGFRGSVVVDGEELCGRADAALSDYRNRAVGFVFQSFHLLPRFTALENVLLPWYFHKGNSSVPEARAHAALAQVGLGGRAGALPRELSGGERQRVAIARALFAEPKLVLADEPTGNLDAASAAAVLELFAALHARGATIVLVTHEAHIAARAQRVVHMRDGALA